MKTIWIVGVGMSRDTLTQEGLAAIRNAEVLLGAPRLVALFADMGKQAFCEYLPQSVLAAVESGSALRFAVLVSGDTGFFSAASGIGEALRAYDVRFVAGVSSLHYFFARLKRPWQGAAIVSCHGRDGNIVDAVRRNKLTFALTGGNVREIANKLVHAGYGGLRAVAGENLGAESERIAEMPVSALESADIGALSVLLIENPNCDARIRTGIPDGEFMRGEVPMTKAEVRSVTLSKLGLAPDTVCCDVGCGTGSVSVEMALAAYSGTVYAVDKNPEALRLTEENAAKFHIGNIKSVLGEAVELLSALPPMDAVCIGGSGGQIKEIFAAIRAKHTSARIVLNAIALESVSTALEAFRENGIEPKIVQVSVSRARAIGGKHLMTAQNPVWILSGGAYE